MTLQEFITLDAELKQFSTMGPRSRYLFDMTISEGVKYFADETGCFWLLDEVTLNQHRNGIYSKSYQLWNLTISPLDRTKASLCCFNRNNQLLFRKVIERELFPLETMELIVLSNTIMLPTEYH
ncbi:hypothetical protein JGUZn3_12030 [Entomobacter blattae]|uniref:DUF6876 domain-containing protein n=2 Tax=Entomobacter blattae TaxID=2762277 RepID=A0A7H1NRL9_9PROT|nr:hypothetical protein JGUZn3_03250 [Entomobacter blattae]QNT78429.1 hypothetical protein JGUZn3_12030 [Entomobacter blattae]